MLRIGLISDTHGLLRPAALEFLQGSEAIVHGGDIGDPEILAVLGRIAKVTAVRGNNDHGPWAERIPHSQTLRFGAVGVHVVHDISELAIDPEQEDIQVVVCGHSHQPKIERRNGVLYINPGSAGPRRFRLPIALGELVIDGDAASARILPIA